MEIINTVLEGPKWASNFKIHIPKSKDVAMVEAIDNSDIKVYSDGSCFKGEIGVAVVLYRNGEEKEVVRAYLGAEDKHTVFEVELVGEIMAAKLLKREKGQIFMI